MIDYYKVLGVDRNASQEDIKKAYKKLAIKYHPDKWAKASKEDQQNAEKKFKEINEAYDALTNPNKKSNYNYNDDMFKGFWENSFNMDFGGWNDFFGNASKKQQTYKPQPIYYTISINDIKDLYKDITKKYKYYAFEICDECGGLGGKNKITCTHCHGTGKINETKQFGSTILNTAHQCNYCKGLGYTFEHTCTKCNGNGSYKKQKEIEVKIPKFVKDGQQIVVENVGHHLMQNSYGDVIFNIKYNFPENYKIQNGNIYELISIPYYDALIGSKIKHVFPSGNTKDVLIPENTKNYDTITVPNEGLNGNNYYVVVQMKYPNKITKEEKEYLTKIKKIYEKGL